MEKKALVCVLCGTLFLALGFSQLLRPATTTDNLKNNSAKPDNSIPLSEDVNFWSNIEPDRLSRAITDRMTNDELLAQIFMFGWAGQSPSPLLIRWVTERGLGSVKVFGWNTDNIKNVALSVKSLQQESAKGRFSIPLFVATDQEGGWIRHVKGDTLQTPGNLAIGASGYPLDAYYSGYYINREIKALGININFAPVVDLYTDLKSTVIGPRSFCSDPENAGILSEAFCKGSLDAGVIPTAKHFPGHGDTNLDSHGKLPSIDINQETWEKRELVPFKHLVDCDVPAIMSGHLSFPQMDTDGRPASLSKYFLTDILRGSLGYKGLIITDDMMMNGATEYAGSLANAVIMAIEAGNDIVISSTTAGLNEALWRNSISKMSSNKEFYNRVKDAARRVIYTKLVYFKGENPAPLYPDETSISDHIPDKEGEKFFLEQACRSITVYKSGSLLPFKPKKNEKVLVAGPFLSLYSEARKRYPNISTFHYSYELNADQSNYDEWNASNFVNVASGFDTIIVNVYDSHTANICKRLKNMGKKVIVLSVLSPVHIMKDMDFADTILCGYSYSDYSFAALFGALNGEFKPEGVLPIAR